VPLKHLLRVTYGLTAIGVLMLSFAVETGQYYHFIYKMGWENSAIARNFTGNNFQVGRSACLYTGHGIGSNGGELAGGCKTSSGNKKWIKPG
jgi:hypothetical protein